MSFTLWFAGLMIGFGFGLFLCQTLTEYKNIKRERQKEYEDFKKRMQSDLEEIREKYNDCDVMIIIDKDGKEIGRYDIEEDRRR